MLKNVMTIAGSDSGAGAGIQADLKTFSALGVYGCTVITAITAQNTQKVSQIFPIEVQVIRDQIDSIIQDIPVNSIKIGMVYNKEIINTLYSLFKKTDTPIILDPIIKAGSGAKLLRTDALPSLTEKLFTVSKIITPNILESQILANIKIKSEDDIIKAAHILKGYGVKNVIIKGGHFDKGQHITDILLDENDTITKFKNKRLKIKETHGSGCNFSSALTAFIAKGFSVIDACGLANDYVHNAIMNAMKVGKGLVVTNPISSMYRDANRFYVISKLQSTVDKIQKIEGFGNLIPETQSNLVFAIPDAGEIQDIAGIRGRIVKSGSMAKVTSWIEFGASKHVASALLAYREYNSAKRAAMNIKYTLKIIETCRSLFPISFYNRKKEPETIKNKEGMSVYWGTKKALDRNPKAEIIYHKGDVGKEPMITIFGNDPDDILNRLFAINQKIQIFREK